MNHPRLRPPARRRLATPRASSSASGWFADRLGYSNADASRIAARIQPHFRERLEWRGADATCQRVQNELGLNDRELRSIVTRWPLLVGLSFDDVVLPSTVNMGRLNPDTKAHGETSLMWTRDNADFGGGGGAYYKTLAALRNLTAAPRVAALLASLPYGDERSTADDAKIVEGVVAMVLP